MVCRKLMKSFLRSLVTDFFSLNIHLQLEDPLNIFFGNFKSLLHLLTISHKPVAQTTL